VRNLNYAEYREIEYRHWWFVGRVVRYGVVEEVDADPNAVGFCEERAGEGVGSPPSRRYRGRRLRLISSQPST